MARSMKGFYFNLKINFGEHSQLDKINSFSLRIACFLNVCILKELKFYFLKKFVSFAVKKIRFYVGSIPGQVTFCLTPRTFTFTTSGTHPQTRYSFLSDPIKFSIPHLTLSLNFVYFMSVFLSDLLLSNFNHSSLSFLPSCLFFFPSFGFFPPQSSR